MLGIVSSILMMGSIPMSLNAQAKQEALYVPCQEMPDVMTKYEADYGALVRFYAPGSSGRWGRTNDPGGSPERRARMTKLRNDYLAKLAKLDFNALPHWIPGIRGSHFRRARRKAAYPGAPAGSGWARNADLSAIAKRRQILQ